MSIPRTKIFAICLTVVSMAFFDAASAEQAHLAGESGGHGDSHAHRYDFGEPGVRDEATRTINVVMYDNYFEPETLGVSAGETVLFVITNEGEFLHEFSLGTAAMHAEHQEHMMTMLEHGMLTDTGIDHEMMQMDHSGMDMGEHAHDDPNSILVEPGQTAELVWTFAETTGLEFACNVPGHYDSGMMGDVMFGAQSMSAGDE